jgi:hypothetical protein
MRSTARAGAEATAAVEEAAVGAAEASAGEVVEEALAVAAGEAAAVAVAERPRRQAAPRNESMRCHASRASFGRYNPRLCQDFDSRR